MIFNDKEHKTIDTRTILLIKYCFKLGRPPENQQENPMSQPEEPAPAPPAAELAPDNQQPPIQSDSSNPAKASPVKTVARTKKNTILLAVFLSLLNYAIKYVVHSKITFQISSQSEDPAPEHQPPPIEIQSEPIYEIIEDQIYDGKHIFNVFDTYKHTKSVVQYLCICKKRNVYAVLCNILISNSSFLKLSHSSN